jgi:rubrerythrin
MDGERSFDDFLSAVDREGAIAEARGRLDAPVSRGRLLGATGAGAALALIASGRARGAGGLTASDVDILNYALVLEYLQATFYTEAERNAALHGKTARAAQVVGATERAHVRAFHKLLGARAVKRPAFDFQGTTEQQVPFLKTAVAFEDLAVAAYKGQAPKLKSNSVLAAAVGIHSVEARHAAWMRELFGITPAVNAFDKPSSRAAVTKLVTSTGFIVTKPRMTETNKPKYTG